ncbi:aldehyde dehydrogenase family protein [Rathayibacter sp. VKM Ac-2879]|uniref:aldehyde dehydrogenase family protein n=1 Tax=unclassified Rathayibacter TaxID=2609250 RepID=UPI003A5C727C
MHARPRPELTPPTREVTVTIDTATPAATSSTAVHRARAAFPSWAATPPAERGALLRAAAHRVAEHEQELAALNADETGKPAGDALGGVRAGVDTLLQYAELGPVHRGRSLRGGALHVDLALPHPRGVVLALTPWNDPVAVAAGLLGAAIVSGDVVVHKPSERSPRTGALFTSILADALPEGVLTLVEGGGAVGDELARTEGVDVLAHVGSTATGRALARVAAVTGAHVILENGGNDALVVDRDVDPVWAAEQAALGAFANAGQICTSVERVYVHREIAEAFTAALVAEAERWSAGPLPRLVDGRMRDAVHEHVAEALASGARALTGGTPGDGTFYPATVLADCTDEMLVMTEETFGPVAPILVVDSFDEGLARAAASPYGLAASVLTADMEHAHRAAATLPVGTVKVNGVFGGAPGGSAQPRGTSGSGFGYGPELLDEMTTTTVVHFGLPVLLGGAR